MTVFGAWLGRECSLAGPAPRSVALPPPDGSAYGRPRSGAVHLAPGAPPTLPGGVAPGVSVPCGKTVEPPRESVDHAAVEPLDISVSVVNPTGNTVYNLRTHQVIHAGRRKTDPCFCHAVRGILEEAGRGEDYVEIGLGGSWQWNPLDDPVLDPYSLAYTVSSLINQLFGKSREPFWQQAYTNLVRWIIELHRLLPGGWVTLRDIYRCTIDAELFVDTGQHPHIVGVEGESAILCASYGLLSRMSFVYSHAIERTTPSRYGLLSRMSFVYSSQIVAKRILGYGLLSRMSFVYFN